MLAAVCPTALIGAAIIMSLSSAANTIKENYLKLAPAFWNKSNEITFQMEEGERQGSKIQDPLFLQVPPNPFVLLRCNK